MDDDPSNFGKIGLFTIETGDWQPFAPKSVFYDSINNSIGTSFITVRDETANVMWVNTDWSRVPAPDASGPYTGYTVQRMNTQPATIANIPGGFSTTYTLPGLTVVQEVVILGSTSFNSSVRHTVTVTNTSGSARTVGARFLWDWMVAAIDASYFRPRDPDGVFSNVFVQYPAPAFQKYEAADSPTIPSFQIFGTVGGGSLLLPPTQPEELRYAAWPVASKTPWNFTTTGSGDDSAIVYYWGGQAGIPLAPGSATTFTEYVTTRLDALTRGVPSLSLRLSNTGYVCGGEAVSYTLGWRNIGDGTVNDLLLTVTLSGGVNYLPGSRSSWSSPAPVGPSSVTASSWSNGFTGPYVEGEAPGTGNSLFLRWMIDRVVPGQSGELRFIANVKPGNFYGTTNETGLTATQNYDSAVFRATNPGNVNIAVTLSKFASPPAVNAGETVRYKLFIQTQCTETVYNLQVFDSLPAGAVNLVPLGGGVMSGTTMVHWTIPSLPPGATRWLEFDATMTGAKSIVLNTACMDYDALKNQAFEPQDRLCSNQSQVDVHIPQLLFRKFVDKNPAPRQGQIKFTLDVINEFTVTLTGITLWDSLPPNMAFASAPAGAYNATDNRVDWTLGNLAPTANTHVDLFVDLSGTCWALGPNIAGLAFTPGVPFPASPRFASTIPIALEQPLLVVTKWGFTDPVVQSGELTYHLFIQNVGGDSAENILAWDSVPARTSFLSADPPGWVLHPGTPDIVEWTLAELRPGGTMELTFTVSVDGDPAPLGPNRFWTTYGEVSPCPRMSATTDDVFVGKARPVLSMQISPQAQAVPVGGAAEFTLSMTNSGTDTALEVVVTSSIPAGTQLGGCAGPPGWSCTQIASDVRWVSGAAGIDIGGVAGLSYTLTVTGPTVDPCQNLIGSVSYADRARVAFACMSCTSACLTIGDAQLNLAKEASLPVVAQDSNMTYRLTVSSTGSLAAVQVSVWDSLPPGAAFVSCTGGTGCAEAGGVVAWTLPALAPGAVEDLYVSVTAGAAMAQSCTNTGRARYSNPLPFQRPDVVSNDVCVAVVQALMVITMSPAKAVYANGEPVTYTISWTNTGTGPAFKVTLTDVLFPDAIYLTCTDSTGGVPCIYDSSVRQVRWSLGTVGPGASGSVTVTLIPAPGAPSVCDSHDFQNQAAVDYQNSGGVWQPTLYHSGLPALVRVSDTLLRLSLTTTAECVTPGDVVDFRLGYMNLCDETTQNITIWDSVPAGYAFGSMAGGATSFDGTMMVWRVPSVPAGRSGEVSFSLTVTGTPGSLFSLADYTNTATLWQPTAQSNAVALTCVRIPRLTVVKTAAPPTGASPGPVAFTITVRNVTDFTAYGVVVTDQLPPPIRLSGAPGTPNTSSTGAVWSVGDLEPHGARTLSLTAVAPDATKDYTNYLNTAVAHYLTEAGFPLADEPGGAPFTLTAAPGVRPHPNPVDFTRGERLRFIGLDPGARVHIFTVSGSEIMVLGPSTGHTLEWDGRNRSGTVIAAGICVYAVEIPDAGNGTTWRRGKFGVIR